MLMRKIQGLCILFILPLSVRATEPNVGQLIEAYERSLHVLVRSSYEIETKMAITGIQDFNSPEAITRKSVVYRDGDQWATLSDERIVFKRGGQQTEEIFHNNQIINSKYIIYRADNNEPVRVVFASSDIDRNKVRIRAALGAGIVAEGYLPGNDEGNISLLDVLRGSSALNVQSEQAEIDGHSTYVLESVSKYGKTLLWLDPLAGFHPRRITVHKKGADLLDGRPVSSIRSEGNIVADKQLVDYLLVVDSVKIEQIGGVFVMTGANMTETRTYVDGSRICATYNFTCSNINLNPDFVALKAFAIKVPDGTPVNDKDFEAGNLIVVGGKIVSRADNSFREIDQVIEGVKKQ